MKLIGKIIAVVTIIIAIYNFDWHTLNQILMPVLLIIVATMILIQENKSSFARKLHKFLVRASLAIAIFLILKTLFYG